MKPQFLMPVVLAALAALPHLPVIAQTASSTPAAAVPAMSTSAGAASSERPAGNAAMTPAITPAEEALKKSIEERLNLKFDGITPIPAMGLYELRSGKDIVYTDAKGEYLIIGSIIDLKNRTNLTSERREEIETNLLPKVKLADLPLDSAIKIVRGNGKRTMVAFEDPNCGYCKRLEKSLQSMNDYTLYVFLFPILGPDSIDKAHNIWCANDRAQAWTDWMEKGVLPASKKCDTPIDKNLALAEKLEVTGTPTLFFQNGKRVPGAIDADEMSKDLAAS